MAETKILINLSNRHIHLTDADVEALFGQGHKLTKIKDLLQPGQYAADEVVTIKGPKGTIEGVRVLGPTRKETQCEILSSDVFRLGVKGCPVSESGVLEGSLPIEIIGPKGSIKTTRGLIIAKRHIHFSEDDAKRYEVKDKQIVKLRVATERGATFDNVVCRVRADFTLECHLDFDEGNAVGIGNGFIGELIK